MPHLLKCHRCGRMFDAEEEQPKDIVACPQCLGEFDAAKRSVETAETGSLSFPQTIDSGCRRGAMGNKLPAWLRATEEKKSPEEEKRLKSKKKLLHFVELLSGIAGFLLLLVGIEAVAVDLLVIAAFLIVVPLVLHVYSSKSEATTPTKRRLMRFFLILAVGAIWPYLSALLITPFIRHGYFPPYLYLRLPIMWIPFTYFSLHTLLLWLLCSGLLPWLVLAIISTFRNRLGFAFWCAAVPIGALEFGGYAYCQCMSHGDGCEVFLLQYIPILPTLIAVPCACVGAAIQWVIDRDAPEQTKRRLTRFFLILAVGAIWPFLLALLIAPFARDVSLPYFFKNEWHPHPLTFSIPNILPRLMIISIPNLLPWFVLAIISTLRNRLGFAFWCAAVPIGGLQSWYHAIYFLKDSYYSYDGRDFMLLYLPLLATVIAVTVACVGAVIQLALAFRSQQPETNKGPDHSDGRKVGDVTSKRPETDKGPDHIKNILQSIRLSRRPEANKGRDSNGT